MIKKYRDPSVARCGCGGQQLEARDQRPRRHGRSRRVSGRPWDLTTVGDLAKVLADRDKLILDLIGNLELQLQELLPIAGTTVGGFELRATKAR